METRDLQAQREELPRRVGPSPRSLDAIPWGEIYSAFTSQFGSDITAFLPTLTAATDAESTSMAMLVTMTTTAEVTVPVSTEVVETTVLKTSFVTVSVTTGVVQSASASTSSLSLSLSSTVNSKTSALSIPTSPSSASSRVSGSTLEASRRTTLPVVATSSDQSQTSTGSTTLAIQTKNPTATPSSAYKPIATSSTTTLVAKVANHSQKHAIIGGLCGSIAGLVLIGSIIFLYLRKRRRRSREESIGSNILDDEAADGEKGLRPTIKRKWSELTAGRSSPRQAQQLSHAGSPITVDEENHFIRMSLQHWSRPFAEGRGEGYRESVQHGRLRVTNPDPSRPTTPRMSSDTASTFLKRQRGALAAVLLSANRSRADSRSNLQGPPQIPQITIDPALSQECVAITAPTPSFRSYASSMRSEPVVTQLPPEDPFLTPDATPEDEEFPARKPVRPSLAHLQSAASAATRRTLSNIGNVLNPFGRHRAPKLAMVLWKV